MTCSEILKSALRLLNEKGDEGDHEDYAERTPYILASMFSEASSADKNFRAANGGSKQPSFSHTYADLDGDFPLSDRFASAAVFYLASMLIIDENDELSDSFYDKYCDSLASIISETPAISGKTKNVY